MELPPPRRWVRESVGLSATCGENEGWQEIPVVGNQHTVVEREGHTCYYGGTEGYFRGGASPSTFSISLISLPRWFSSYLSYCCVYVYKYTCRCMSFPYSQPHRFTLRVKHFAGFAGDGRRRRRVLTVGEDNSIPLIERLAC